MVSQTSLDSDLAVLRNSARAFQRMSFDLGLSALLFSQVYMGVMLFGKKTMKVNCLSPHITSRVPVTDLTDRCLC